MKIERKQIPARPAKTGVPNPFKPGELMDVAARPATNKVKVRPLKALKDMVYRGPESMAVPSPAPQCAASQYEHAAMPSCDCESCSRDALHDDPLALLRVPSWPMTASVRPSLTCLIGPSEVLVKEGLMLFYRKSESLSARFRTIFDAFLQTAGLPFANLLDEEEIQRVFDEEGVCFASEEDRVYTPAVTLWAFLSQMLVKDEQRSCLAAVARVGLFHFGRSLLLLVLHDRAVAGTGSWTTRCSWASGNA